ncbi:hemerythrin domain-containing protein [Nonomuraea sp. NPDC049709]|uniref:hemerythrin domain-containing protein n=1 Tax=Nonomuraea sp. NPDC049709 TaxID=3154736 RepID=UPI00341F681E
MTAPLEGAERDRAYARQAALDPAFAAYQAQTDRVIPVIALYPERERLQAFGDELARIHDHLRGELAGLRAGETPAADLRAHCQAFCGALTFHHTGEDRVAFPHLEKLFPELKQPLDRLRDEHAVIAGLIEELRGATGPATLDRIAGEMEATSPMRRSSWSRCSTPWRRRPGRASGRVPPAGVRRARPARSASP